MTMFERLHMPSLGGAAAWLNSEPLGPAELRGHVVLVNWAAGRPVSPEARALSAGPAREAGRLSSAQQARHPGAEIGANDEGSPL